jgi:hypothetical protein
MGSDDMPLKVATDFEGNFYVADRDFKIKKYDSTLGLNWERDVAGAVDDMIVDGQGRIYVAYHIGGGIDTWVVRAMGSEGSQSWQVTLDGIPYVAGQTAWLAMGVDGELMFVSSTGRMAVFEGEGLEFEPSEPGRLEPASSFGGVSHYKRPGD